MEQTTHQRRVDGYEFVDWAWCAWRWVLGFLCVERLASLSKFVEPTNLRRSDTYMHTNRIHVDGTIRQLAAR